MSFFIDDKKVGGVKEVCAALGIDPKTVPYKRRSKEFEMIMERDAMGNPKRDGNGRYSTTRKIAGKPEFRAFIPSLGYEVRVRFATTQIAPTRDEGYKYPDPTILSLDPAEDGSISINDEIIFTWWYLNPLCAQSPFHRLDQAAYYEYKDEDAKSKTANNHEENLINALGYIVGNHAKSVKELRSIAKGLNVPAVDDMTDDVVKSTLRTIAKSNPLDFINKVDSREIIFSGRVQDAIDRGIIKMDTLNGMSRWYLSGKEIIPIPFGTDAMQVLKEEMSTKWYLYSDEIDNALNGVTIASNLDNPDNDTAFVDTESHKIESKAELTPEQRVWLKKMEEDIAFDEKIKKLAAIDPNDSTVHFQTKKSYEANIEAINAYKASLKEPVVAEEITA